MLHDDSHTVVRQSSYRTTVKLQDDSQAAYDSQAAGRHLNCRMTVMLQDDSQTAGRQSSCRTTFELQDDSQTAGRQSSCRTTFELQDDSQTAGRQLKAAGRQLRPDTTVQNKCFSFNILSAFWGSVVSSLLKNVDKH